ncbi:MAG: hypothetical protein KY476_24630, partial [Planctomycetes bacterium]|nr:hypothetical protein [Planctomycetota bacterium]
MLKRHLDELLDRVGRRQRSQRMQLALAGWWLAGALVCGALSAALLADQSAARRSESAKAILLLGTAWLGLGAAAALGIRMRRCDRQATARAIETRYPELNDRLLAAVEQSPDLRTGTLSFLQKEVFYETLEHARRHDWRQTVPTRRYLAALACHVTCLAGFAAVIGVIATPAAAVVERRPEPTGMPLTSGDPRDAYGLVVEPGDVELERGASLLVLARFEKKLPAEATAVLEPRDGPLRRLTLSKSLDDPLFAGSIANVQSDGVYRIEFDGLHTDPFRVRVFEYPRLERADVTVYWPDYAGRTATTLAEARRVSLVEGSTVVLSIEANKPLASAELIDDQGRSVAGTAAAGAEISFSITIQPQESSKLRLRLRDAHGRENRDAPLFVFDVVPNRRPELALKFPAKDLRVSPLEEITLEAHAWDDFGIVATGLQFSIGGEEPRSIVLNQASAAERPGQEADFTHRLLMEELHAEPDQLVSYCFFADDIGPDGTPRRTFGDMFFAEVRHFEEIFREAQQPPGGGGGPQGGPQGEQIEQ